MRVDWPLKGKSKEERVELDTTVESCTGHNIGLSGISKSRTEMPSQ